ncbi:MAG TPA: hypothetical protein VJ276_17765 [Thermoanaerobaculia bacterium]|nr:hypothetical protein [Thermoanaerobaculia bacterium]
MNRLVFGLICGAVFGLIDVLLMIPLSFPDKRIAMAGAFFDRFAIGLFASVAELPLPGWAVGLLAGTLISLPSAIITRKYVPILVIGAVGGAVIGVLRARLQL